MCQRAILLSLMFTLSGCASSSGNDSAQTGSAASGGHPGIGGNGAGLGGQVGGNGGLVSATSGAGGQPGSAGISGDGATGGRGGAADQGGAAGNTAGAGQAGSAGSSVGGAAGAGGSLGGHGSAAKSVCVPKATYGNPLQGMGAVSTIPAPASDHFVFTEGTIWIAGLATLFFSDNASTPSERIFKLVPPSTTAALFVGNSGSNGLAVDNSDRLIAADQRNKRIVRFDPMTGTIVGTPISTGSAKPNDLIVRSDENVYFTDPDSGFYRILPSGTVSAAMKLASSNRPNGIELSLDESTPLAAQIA